MSRRTALTRPIVVAAVLLVEAELIAGPVASRPLQVALALPLAFYAPGAALGRALTRQAEDGLADQLVTSFGLSLAVLVVGGVGLNLLAVGLRPMTWLAYLAVVTLSAELAAAVGIGGSSAAAAVRIPRPQMRQLPAALTIMAVLAAAFVVSIVGAHRQKSPGFVQLWLLPHGGGPSFGLGVSNDTAHEDAYSVKLKAAGREVGGWRIKLPPGQSWSAVVRLPVHASATATLFRDGTPTPYRQVFIRDTSAEH